jgi:hypothetical protein
MSEQWRVTTFHPGASEPVIPTREYDTASGAALFIGLAGAILAGARFTTERRDGGAWRSAEPLELVEASAAEEQRP